METSLEQLLKDVDAPTDVLQILKDLGCGKADLFATAIKDQDDVPKLLAQSRYKDSIGVEAQLRLAWLQAKTNLSRTLKRRAEGLVDEVIDSPLDPSVHDSLISSACTFYNWKRVDPHRIGSNRLIGRFKREFSAYAHSVFPIKKVVTSAEASQTGEAKRSRIADRMTLVMDDEEDGGREAKGIDLLMWLDFFETLTSSWAICGCYDVEFVGADGKTTKMKFAHLSDVDQYRREFVVEAIALRKEFTDSSVMEYLDVIELFFRGIAVELGKPPQRLPWGMALLRALESKSSIWTKRANILIPRRMPHKPEPTQPNRGLAIPFQPNQPNVPNSPGRFKHGDKNGGKQKEKGKGKGKRTKEGKTPCFLYNGSGCNRSDCRFDHVCSAVLSDGMACGSKHKASEHDPKKHGKTKS